MFSKLGPEWSGVPRTRAQQGKSSLATTQSTDKEAPVGRFSDNFSQC
jgi:hypothetical protein